MDLLLVLAANKAPHIRHRFQQLSGAPLGGCGMAALAAVHGVVCGSCCMGPPHCLLDPFWSPPCSFLS